MAAETVLAVVLFIFAVGFGVFGAYYTLRPKEDDLKFNDGLLNFCSDECDKRFMGEIINEEVGAENRVIIKYLPRDVDIRGMNRKEIKDALKPQKIIVDPEQIIVFPKGELSQDRNYKVLLAKNAGDYPQSIKETNFGRAFMWVSEKQNLEKNLREIMQEGRETRDEILKKINEGEFTREMVTKWEEFMKDALRVSLTDKDKKQGQGNFNTGDVRK